MASSYSPWDGSGAAAEAWIRFGVVLERANRQASFAYVADVLARHVVEKLPISILEESEKWAERQMPDRKTWPLALSEVADIFAAIPQVKEIRVVAGESKSYTLHVFVDMPHYNNEVMDHLIDAEIVGDKTARALRFRFDYKYYPLPQSSAANVGLTDAPIYRRV